MLYDIDINKMFQAIAALCGAKYDDGELFVYDDAFPSADDCIDNIESLLTTIGIKHDYHFNYAEGCYVLNAVDESMDPSKEKYVLWTGNMEMPFINKAVPDVMFGDDIVKAYLTDGIEGNERYFGNLEDAQEAFRKAKESCRTWISSTICGKCVESDVLVLEKEFPEDPEDPENLRVDILDTYAADLIQTTFEQEEFIDNLIEECSRYLDPEPISVSDAEYNLKEFEKDPDSYQIPDGLTSELFAAYWNREIEYRNV